MATRYMKPMEGIQRFNGKIAPKKVHYGKGISLFVGYGVKGRAYNYFRVCSVASPRIDDPTEQQIACKTKFAATITAIKQKKANPTEWEAIKEGFKNQSKYVTLWGYAFAVIYPTIS